MARFLVAIVVLVSLAWIASAVPTDGSSSSAFAARSTAKRTPDRAVRLRQRAARRPIERFLKAATQVTALPRSYRITGCRRRSARSIDCDFVITGQSRGSLRARLIVAERAARVQLYVLSPAPVGPS